MTAFTVASDEKAAWIETLVAFRISIWRLLPFVPIFGFGANAAMFSFPIGGAQIPQPPACWLKLRGVPGIVRRLPSTLVMVNRCFLK